MHERGVKTSIKLSKTIDCKAKQVYIKTHGSESRGLEEAGLYTRRTSELFTCSTAVKLANALNKPL